MNSETQKSPSLYFKKKTWKRLFNLYKDWPKLMIKNEWKLQKKFTFFRDSHPFLLQTGRDFFFSPVGHYLICDFVLHTLYLHPMSKHLCSASGCWVVLLDWLQTTARKPSLPCYLTHGWEKKDGFIPSLHYYRDLYWFLCF